MRANALVAVTPAIAIEAQHLKTFRIVIITKPEVKHRARLEVRFTAMFRTIIVDVIDGKKQSFLDSAAGTGGSVMSEDFLFELLSHLDLRDTHTLSITVFALIAIPSRSVSRISRFASVVRKVIPNLVLPTRACANTPMLINKRMELAGIARV
jgi:hypothetical protein